MVLLVLDGVDEAADLSRHIESCVMQLVDDGHRVVVTSRYEGVQLDRYTDFVVMDLKPLSDEQQRAVIEHQLGDNAHFDNLMKFSKIRKKHDKLCACSRACGERALCCDRSACASFAQTTKKHFREGDREAVETMHVPNQFKTESGFNPEMRQHAIDGKRVVHKNEDLLNDASAPKSEFLRRNSLPSSLINELDDKYEKLAPEAEELREEEVVSLLRGFSESTADKTQRSWLTRLLKLAHKQKRRPSATCERARAHR